MTQCRGCAKETANPIWCSYRCGVSTVGRSAMKSTPVRGEKRPKLLVQCDACGTETYNARFCSKSCSAVITNHENPRRKQGPKPLCAGCNTEIAIGRKYCTHDCQKAATTGRKIERWLAGDSAYTTLKDPAAWMRAWLLDAVGHKCEECGWDTPHPALGRPWLTVDHVNGNAEDQRRDNLKVLCLRCHGQTLTYGSLNSASQRAKRGLPDLGRKSARPKEVAKYQARVAQQ